MKPKEPQSRLDRESLKNLTPEQLVGMVLKLQALVVKPSETIEKLQGYLDKNSKTSSKPPSTDWLRKPEKAQEGEKKEGRSPGKQKGHQGKTRKGFERIDRLLSVKAKKCQHCGSQVIGVLPEDILPGLDLGVSLPAMLKWMSHYGHLALVCIHHQQFGGRLSYCHCRFFSLCRPPDLNTYYPFNIKGVYR
jgi:Family of unknown function (DUF6444)